tara:strand:- start:546 stop:779 length:234 start_codon:yes stop_codon:yes gene_type:complete
MKRDGWIKKPNGIWLLKFRYGCESLDQNPKVDVDKGKLECNGITLLKSRKKMPRNLAMDLWRNLLGAGWTRVGPPWD